MSYVWTGMIAVSLFCAVITGSGSALAGAAMQGAQEGAALTLSMAGAICLWSGVGKLLEAAGAAGVLAKLLSPVLGLLFPSTRTDPALAGDLSANICANVLGLGNAATPMGISAAKRLRDPLRPDLATDELCRLIVLNTASIQLLPASTAALRSALGCTAPLDILPAVWVSSLLSAALGLTAAFLLGKAAKE